MIYYLLATFKWMLSSGLTYLILFLGLGIWIKKIIRVKELNTSSDSIQVFFRITLCLLPLVITSFSYRYVYILANLITKTPEGALRDAEIKIQPYLSIGLGVCVSCFLLWYFIFSDRAEDSE